MRTITIDELPEDAPRQTVIKSVERTRHQRMTVALERTLTRCSEIHAEYELQTVRLRENCEREGFEAGFRLFFKQLILFIDDYQRLQNQRQTEFRQHVADALHKSLHDPTIVNRIIHHLQEQCGHQKALRIIIPKVVALPEGADASHYQFTDDNHITVQNDMDAIRFPSESLCHKWIQHADDKLIPLEALVNNLKPDRLRDIASQLIGLSNPPPTSISEQENNNE
ncbi:type III secretion protein [Leclercia adecarboxylata]|nr:type III secretion protein [Leclercia adecarboxylata]KMN64126.1 type III secretion protein [Leclercia sp. LK8]